MKGLNTVISQAPTGGTIYRTIGIAPSSSPIHCRVDIVLAGIPKLKPMSPEAT